MDDKTKKYVTSLGEWRAWGDSNARPTVPETAALNDVDFSPMSQKCHK